MKRKIQAGTTGLLLKIFVQNSGVGTGAGLTGLAYNTAGLTWYYLRNGAGADVQVTLATATLGTWAAGGFVQVDATGMPGVYEISAPNAAIATGADSVHMMLQGAANMVPVLIELELDAVNYQSITSFVTGINALSPPANWDLESIDGSGRVLLQPSQPSVVIPTVTAVTNQLTAAAIATGVWQDTTSGDFTVAASIGKALYTNAAPGATGGHFVAGTNAATTITTALTTTFTGNLTGSVGSVTGSVGSVTGNVGGSVASVTAAVTISTSQLMAAPRALDSISDSAVQINDALWAAYAAGVGQRNASSGTSMVVSTAHTGTVLRTYALSTVSGTPPSYVTECI
jgi:hypothetical protein